MVDMKSGWKKNSSKWRILLVIAVPTIMFYTIFIMLSTSSVIVNNGKANLSSIDFNHSKLVPLDGQWEFYWNRLMTPDDFNSRQRVKMDSFMKVPGVWSDDASTYYSRQGVATYRLMLHYPSTLKDPALRIQNVANAYKLYVNGQLVEEDGSSLNDKVNFQNDDKITIIDLPKDSQKIELVFQIGNLNCATGGLRAAPVFGSKQVLEEQRIIMLLLQMIFIGGVLIFGVHYFFLFFLQTKNKTALIFAIFCFVTALRSLIWGEIPLQILFPNVSPELRMYIN